jgi:hypothetical protein
VVIANSPANHDSSFLHLAVRAMGHLSAEPRVLAALKAGLKSSFSRPWGCGVGAFGSLTPLAIPVCEFRCGNVTL